jgi:hypothetical protein
MSSSLSAGKALELISENFVAEDYQHINAILGRVRQHLQKEMNRVASSDKDVLRDLERIVDIGVKLRDAKIGTLEQDIEEQPSEGLIVLRDAIIAELQKREQHE